MMSGGSVRAICAWVLVSMLAAPACAEPPKPEASRAPTATTQPPKQSKDAPKTSETSKVKAQAPSRQLPVPKAEELLMLIRTTLVALNQANYTNNYTVLQDLGTPSLRASNSSSTLGNAFTDLRNRRIDLSPVVILSPELTETPGFTPDGKLRLAGTFPTKPLRISFIMLFQPIERIWRIDGLSVSATEVKKPAEAAPVASGAFPGTNESFKAAIEGAGRRKPEETKPSKAQ